jgi:lipid-A-disaccharide synthase-like uncharacterized protein
MDRQHAAGAQRDSKSFLVRVCQGRTRPAGFRTMIAQVMDHVAEYLRSVFITGLDLAAVVGLLGQAFFSARFLVQWIASERAGRSVVPLAFWFFSIGGGFVLLGYALYRRDPVFILGQSFGVFIYARNLMLIAKERGASV